MTMRDVPTFGDLVRRYRRDAGMTADALATAVGLSWVELNTLERGGGPAPDADLVARLTSVLKLLAADRAALEAAAAMLARTVANPAARTAPPLESAPVRQQLPVGGYLGSLPDGPIVGRENEIERLRAFVQTVEGGAGRLVLLAGEPGIGKTRLAQELTREAHERGFLVAAGRCYEPQAAVAYYPFLDVLATVYAAAPAAIREQVPHRWAEVARLLPGQDLGPLPSPSTEAGPSRPDDQQRLLWQVTGFLQALLAVQPAAVLLDDLHWADSASIGLLQHLALHTREDRILLLGTYRDIEVGQEHPLVGVLRDLGREQLVERMEVRPLSEEGTRELLAAELGSDVQEDEDSGDVLAELGRVLYARTEGNPFFAHEVVRTLLDRGKLYQRDGHWEGAAPDGLALPETVRSVIEGRLAHLAAPTREVLREASVLGQGFTFDELASMSRRDEEALETILGEAAAAGLVHELGQEDRYTFHHALIQQALYADLPAHKRRRLHRAAGDAIERLPVSGRSRRAAELSQHLMLAKEPTRALPYILQAGDQAEAVYAHTEAEKHYRTAMELAGELDDRERQAEALEKLGGALEHLGRRADALDVHEPAALAYQALGDVEGELRVLAAIAWESANNTIEQAEAALARILPRLSALEAAVAQTGRASPGLASAFLEVPALYYTTGQLEDAVALNARGLQLAREVGDDALLARAYAYRGYARSVVGREGSLEDSLEAVALAERANGDVLGMALNFVTATYLMEGKLALAKQYGERALAVVEQHQVPADIAFQRVSLGEPVLCRGDWDEAREHFAQADAIQERLDPNYTWQISATAPVYLCLLDLAEGRDADDPTRRLEALLALMRPKANHPPLILGAMGEAALAERSLLVGEADVARARLAAFLTLPGHARVAEGRVIALPALAWAEAELGQYDEAAQRLETAIAMATTRRWYLWLVDALRVKGLLALRQQQWEDAQAALDQTITMCQAMPYPYAEAKALYVYGQLHAAKGEPNLAREKYQAALAICARLGEGLYRPHIERALAALPSAQAPSN